MSERTTRATPEQTGRAARRTVRYHTGVIYLDWAATAPPVPEALPADGPWHANPSSPHPRGRQAAAELASARERLACALGVDAAEIVLTSGATESNNLMLQSVLTLLHPERGLPRRDTLVIGAVEHDSVEGPATLLQRIGFRVLRAPVGGDGAVDVERLHELLDERTYLVSVQTVNNETGTIQPVVEAAAAVADAARRSGTRMLFHTDAVQALGKVPLPLGPHVHAASFSAHKIGGPRGVGALWIQAGAPVRFMQAGGEQEGGRRAGTENVAGAAGFAAAAGTATSLHDRNASAAAETMALLIERLRSMPGVTLIPADRTTRDARFSPFILKLAVPALPSEVTVRLLGDRGVCVSPGSACATGSRKRLRVLEAMRVPPEQAAGAVRVSIGPRTSPDEVEAFASALDAELRDVTSRITAPATREVVRT